ncbi:chromosome partitioning protein [Stackebrandtia albiflava]|uniref:MinD/ParA family ATP-binding protein n=1 Tax=Stackebrandtia albiflava TaxID=406432 RepID=UPI003CC7FA4B
MPPSTRRPDEPGDEPDTRRFGAAEAAPEEETTEQHWSPFAPAPNPAGEERPAQHVTPPQQAPQPAPGLNPATQQQPVVAPPPGYAPPYRQPGQAAPPVPPPPQQAPPPGYPPQSGPPHNVPHNVPPHAPHSGVPGGPQSAPPHPGHPPVSPAPPANLPVPFPDQTGALESMPVTADDFARRRSVAPVKPVATMGPRAALRKTTFGLVSLPPSRREQEVLRSTEAVRRNFGGLRQITVVNPKGGAGKTVAVLMLAMMFGQRRGGYVLAWDNNETQGTLGMRAQQDFHHRTVRDLLRDLEHFSGPTGRVGDLSQYVRAQGEAMFDVLASDESATAGEMLTSRAFADIREVVSRFYKLIVVDTGNNVRAANWQSAMDATDQLVVTMSARNDSAETAARMLDHLEQSGRQQLVRQAVTVVSMPAHRKDLDLPAVQRHFSARTRAVLLAPYEKLLDSGEPIRYGMLSPASREAWLKIAAAVAEGL